MVYTNCAKKTDLNFQHSIINSIFDFPESKKIPFIFMDNPLVEVLKTQKLFEHSHENKHGFDQFVLEELNAKFLTAS